MKNLAFLILIFVVSLNGFGKQKESFLGTYLHIDSNSKSMTLDGIWHTNIDSTILTIFPNNTFTYQWEPMFGPRAHKSITTTGKWHSKNNKIYLNSKYKANEYKYSESYIKEYGDSIIKVHVQTFDSLTGFLNHQFISVKNKDSIYREMTQIDETIPFKACVSYFNCKEASEIVFYGDFGSMPKFTPKTSESNYFLMQFNISIDWDYQYFDNFKVKIKPNCLVLNGNIKRLELVKISN